MSGDQRAHMKYKPINKIRCKSQAELPSRMQNYQANSIHRQDVNIAHAISKDSCIIIRGDLDRKNRNRKTSFL